MHIQINRWETISSIPQARGFNHLLTLSLFTHLLIMNKARRVSSICLFYFSVAHALALDTVAVSSHGNFLDARGSSSSAKRSTVKVKRIGKDGRKGADVVAKGVTSDHSLSILFCMLVKFGLGVVLKCSVNLCLKKSIQPCMRRSLSSNATFNFSASHSSDSFINFLTHGLSSWTNEAN